MAKKADGSPYENLANAIIIQACDDYRAELKKIRKNPERREAVDAALRIERFFQSGWFGALTTVDGDFLIRRIRKEAAV